MKPEQKLWKEIGGLLRARGGHYSRIESHATSSGIPDVSFCINGVEGFIELKVDTGSGIKVRQSQAIWLRNRLDAGGRVWYIVRLRNGTTLLMRGTEVHDLWAAHHHQPHEWERVAYRIWYEVPHSGELMEDLTS